MPTMGTIHSRVKEAVTGSAHNKLSGLDAQIYSVMDDAIKRLARRFPKADEWRARETITAVTAGNESTLTLTTSFSVIESLFNITDDWPLRETPEHRYEAVYGQAIDTSPGPPRQYFPKSDTVIILDRVPSVSTSVEVKGFKIPAERATTDSGLDPDLGELWHSYVRHYTIAILCTTYVKKPETANLHLQLANECMTDFARRIRRRLSEQGGLVQTRSEHVLQSRGRRGRWPLRDW